MKPRLWLHVGPNKTGTTSIQDGLTRFRDQILAQGVLYPRLPGKEVWPIARTHHVLADNLLLTRAAEGRGWIRELVEALPDMPDTIVSSENFCKQASFRQGLLNRFSRVLSRRYDTRVIFYARHPLDHATSRAQEGIKSGHLTLHVAMHEAKRFPLRQRIEEFQNAFGADKVIVRPFVPASFVGGDLVSDFCAAIGRPGLIDGRNLPRRNESITMETAIAIDAYRARTGDTGRVSADDERFHRPGQKFRLAPEAAEHILSASRRDLDWLAAVMGIRFPDPALPRAPSA